MASIRDVAIKAGVGIGTVSRALNGSGYISDETKQKIMQAVEELNYKPNELAQNLFHNKSGFIGIVVTNLSHPFMTSLVKHVENNLYTNGNLVRCNRYLWFLQPVLSFHRCKCMLCEVGDNPNRIEEFVEMLQRNVMDGIICCADIPSSISLAEIHRPIVMVDRYVTEGIPCIHSDHKRGGELAAQALLSAGCKSVVYFVSSATERAYSMDRYRRFAEVCKQHKCKITAIDAGSKILNFQSGPTIWKKYISHFDGIDGLFTADVTAAACMKMLQKKGIKIPKKLKVVGYDGLDFTRFLTPELTTVCQNVPEIAKRSVDTIIRMIDGKKIEEMEQIVDVTFRKGEST